MVTADFVLPRWRANSAPPNLLAEFKGPLGGGGKRGERKERRGKGQEGKGRDETPRNKFLVTALHIATCALAEKNVVK